MDGLLLQDLIGCKEMHASLLDDICPEGFQCWRYETIHLRVHSTALFHIVLEDITSALDQPDAREPKGLPEMRPTVSAHT